MGAKEPTDQVRLKIFRRGRGFMNIGLALEEFPKVNDLPIAKDLF